MYVKYSPNKCPICGNFGNTLKKNLFHCGKCSLEYDKYVYYGEPNVESSSQWN